MDAKSDKSAEFSEPLKAPEHSFDITAPSLNSSTSRIDIDSTPKYFDTNIFNRLLFSWVSAFIDRGKRQTFTQDQHYDLRDKEDCNWIGEHIEKEWNYSKHKRSSLFRANYRTFRKLMWASQILACIQTFFEFTGPILVAKIISYIQTESSNTTEGVLLIICFVLSRLGLIIVSTQNLLTTTLLMNKVQKGTMGLLYRKFMRFPLIRSQKYSTGSIMNYMLVDVENLSKIFYFLPQLVQFPVMLVVGVYMIYTTVHLAFVGGLVSIIVLGLFISLVGKNTHRCQKALLNAKDVRMKKTNEILTGIKYIKMWGAEEKFLESVLQDREMELYWVRKKHFFATLRIFLFWLSPVLLSVSVFGCYTLFGYDLTPQQAFVVLSTLMIVQGPVFNIGNILNDFLQGQVSLSRVEKFMFAEEIDLSYINRTNDHSNPVSIKISDGNFYWNHIDTKTKENRESSQKNENKKLESILLTDNVHTKPDLILKDINLEIKKGAFVAILGDVGSGKSSLLQALLGEMLHDKAHPPSIEINGTISYIAQKPWIVNATIKDNIIFDNYYDEDVYQRVLRASCLLPDLKTFIRHDQTEIGEKGANLSGGQKARIALARAIYSDSDIYLLDDPLSAVDAHVGKFILQECLTGTLKNRTRILVTHKLESLRYVDYIYILKAGQIVCEGDLGTIKNSTYYKEMELQAIKEETEEKAENHEKEVSQTIDKIEDAHTKHFHDNDHKSTGRQEQIEDNILCEKNEHSEVLDKLMLNEDRQTGAVSLLAWINFFRYFGTYKYFTLLISSIVIWIALKTGLDFWLAHWSSNAQDDPEHGNGYYLGIYSIIGFTSVMFIFVRIGLVIMRGYQVSRRLHAEMFGRIIRAPINLFFDRIPLGRLLNRFSTDLDIVDGSLPFTLGGLLYHPVNLTARLFMCYVAGSGWILPSIVAFGWLGMKIQQRYLSIYRESHRLYRSTATPVTSFFAESLDGLPYIRISDDQPKFLKKYASRQNENLKNQILIVGLKGWFHIRINAASLLIVVPTISIAIMFSGQLNDSPALIGLLLTYLLDISGTMITFLQQIGIFEAQLISFERCRSFTNIDIERAPKTMISVKGFSSSWPQQGEIELRNFYTKYRPSLPYVLRDTSFKINGGEKIGVVGRTGSGKSTILLSLLRIIEAQAGKIFIDGVDIAQLGLDDLRRKITVIPQDPLLYKGTIRTNLDLLNQYSDAQIWNALEKVNMKNKFRHKGLEAEIKEGGGNLSAGEKQLVCIARAILNKNKIIFVDEATSSIDNVTEETIIKSVHDNFSDCTMITIAHRLKTIIGSDRILFMRDGQVLEFDTPKALLTNKNGHFYSLWREYEAAKA